jgi:DNA-binding NarL/FixJ family response regulator
MDDVRVFVVDDQAPFRDAARAVIELTDGFLFVGEAATGEESLVETARLHPDLVIMDVNLPGIDGIEATRRMTRNDKPAVLLVSTYDEQDYARLAAECGAIAYLPKSEFGPDALVDGWAAARS